MSDDNKTQTEKPEAAEAAAKAPAAEKAPAAKAKSVKTPVRKSAAKPAATQKSGTKPAAAKAKPAKAPKAAKPVKAAARTGSKAMNDTIESMTTASNEALKEGFEKTLKSVTEVSNFQKENVDALIESATVAGKGLESVNANAVAYAKSVMEDGVTATKAMASAKSVQEIYEIQSTYTKTAMDHYLAELNKTTDLVSDMFKNSMKPINDRVSAAVEFAQAQR